jgi:hypothetical protein
MADRPGPLTLEEGHSDLTVQVTAEEIGPDQFDVGISDLRTL